jgi:MFS family permease
VPMVFGTYFFQGDESSQYVWIALLFAVPALMSFVGQNYWGGLFDHSGHYKPFIVASFLVASAAFLMLTLVENAAGFIALLGFGTFFSVAIIPVGQVYATVTYEKDKGRVLGALFAFESLGGGLACLMGATSWAALPNPEFLDRLFQLSLGLSLLTGVAVQVFFSAPPLENHPAGENRLRALLAEWSVLYHDRKVLSMAAVLSAITCGSMIFLAWYTPYLCKFLGGSKELLGRSLGLGTFVAAVSFPLYGLLSDRFGRKPLILASTVGYVGLYASFIFIRDPDTLAYLYALPLYPAVRVALNAFLADMTSSSSRGGGLGVLEGAQAMSSAVAPVMGGIAVHTFGYASLPVAACALMMVSTVMVMKMLLAEPARVPASCGSDGTGI